MMLLLEHPLAAATAALKFRWSSAFAAAQQLLSDAGWFLRCRKTDKSLNESDDHHHQKGRRQDFLGEEKL